MATEVKPIDDAIRVIEGMREQLQRRAETCECCNCDRDVEAFEDWLSGDAPPLNDRSNGGSVPG